jgi:Flp pilus assembly protein TadB
MNLILYGVIALAILATVSGLAWKVRESGKESVRLEWAEANAAAQKKAEAERQRQDALRATQDKEATKRLADAKRRNATLLTSLEAHIKVARLPADCKLPPSLLGDVNAAIAGQSLGTGTVPSKPGTPTPAR